MNVLGIETSTHAGSVAVIQDKRLLGELSINVRPAHSQKLVPMIKSLLGYVEVEKADLDGIAVSIGPGYYTALRVGLSTAKALSYSLGIPLVGVSSLEALAMNVSGIGGMVCPVIDAKMTQVYAALFECSEPSPIRRAEDMVLTAEELLGMVEGDTVFVGDVGLIAKAVSSGAHMDGVPTYAPSLLCTPRASACAVLGARQLGEGRSHDRSVLVPSYMRRTQAEIAKEESRL